MQNSDRRVRLAGLVVAFATTASLLAACTPTSNGDATVRLAYPFEEVWGEPLQVAVDSYEKANPGVNIEIESMPYEGYVDTLQTQLVGGAAADILFVEPPAVSNFAGREFLLPLDDELSSGWSEEFVEGILDATRSADGSQYMVPWSSVAVLVAYRESIFSEAGIESAPTTWGEWIEAMDDLSGGNVTPLNVSLRGDDASTWWLLTNKLNATLRPLTEEINLLPESEGWTFDPDDLSSAVGEVYSTDELYVAFQKGLIDPAKAPGYRAAVEQVLEIAPFLNQDTATVQPTDVISRFSTAEVPQLIGVGESIADAAAGTDEAADFGTFNLPTITEDDWSGLTAGGENPLAGPRNGFVVNAASEVQSEAIAFLKYLTQPETVSAVYAVKPQGDPSAIAGVELPEGSVLPDTGGQKYAEISPYGFGSPPTFDSEDFDAFNAQWQALLTGNSSIDEFLVARSASNLAALERNLVLNADSIDQSFIDEELGQ